MNTYTIRKYAPCEIIEEVNTGERIIKMSYGTATWLVMENDFPLRTRNPLTGKTRYEAFDRKKDAQKTADFLNTNGLSDECRARPAK